VHPTYSAFVPRRWLTCAILAIALGVLTLGCAVERGDPPVPQVSVTPVDSALATRAAHTATELPDGTAVVVGGCDVDGCSTATDSVALLTPDGVRALSPLSSPRDGHIAVLLDDGGILVAGGYEREGSAPLVTAEIFDPVHNRWSSTGSLRTPRGGHAAARLGDGRVLVVGGWRGSGSYLASTEIFDPRTGRFVPGPDLPTGVSGVTATSLSDGRVLVTGGQVDETSPTGLVVLVGADGKARELAVGLRTPRFKHAAVILPSEQVLIIGGTVDDRELLTSTELFDPRTESFSAGPPLVGGRYKLNGAASVLPDGRVVVAGGGHGVEVVDIDRGTSTQIAGLDDVHASFSTVSVVGTDVWVIGGYDRQIRMTATNRRIPISSL
jgi:hypothetical protein